MTGYYIFLEDAHFVMYGKVGPNTRQGIDISNLALKYAAAAASNF